MNERILQSLKAMIAIDETMLYIESSPGEFSEKDENAHWLAILQEAQRAYYEYTGEKVKNALGVLLIPEEK